MELFNRINGRAAAAIVVAVFIGAGLSGCGSHDRDDDYSNGGNTPSNPTPIPTPTPVADAFYSTVANVVGASNDTGEPNPIDAVAVTAPDMMEPEPLG